MCYDNSQVIPKLICVIVLLIVLFNESRALVLRAYISQHGLHGEIEFSHKNISLISIRTNLKPTIQYPDGVWRWTIHEFPVDYRDISRDRCSNENLGKEIIDLTEELGYLIIPGKDHAEYESKTTLTGKNGLWGKSIVLETAERDRIICASIVATEQMYEKRAEARFHSPVAGTLSFNWLFAREFDEEDAFIVADLYHTQAVTDKVEYTEHKWKLFVTDIFDSDKGSYEDNCNVLQIVFDPENNGDGASVGDLDKRLGYLKVATDGNIKKTKTLYKEDILHLLRSDMEITKRSLYVVIYDARHKDNFLACAKLRLTETKSTKAYINMDGIKGTVDFTQRSPFNPTWVNFQLAAADREYESNLRFVSSMATYSIRELPPNAVDSSGRVRCDSTGHVYNPSGISAGDIPPPGMGTQDQYPLGDLFGKYKDRTEYLNHKYLLPGLANELSGAYWDVYLPLYGISSVVHRALVLERHPPKMDVCSTILLYQYNTEYQVPMRSAEVIFRYPIVGKVLFRQPLDKPWEDTTIIVEGLVHADGAVINNTFEHRWSLNERAPGADFYNWSQRCVSAGPVMHPHRLLVDLRHPDRYCTKRLLGLCHYGDLTTRHGTLSIAGSKAAVNMTRRVFTDSLVQLSGKYSALKRSLVIYDDHGPIARGERLACSIIQGYPRRKAVVRGWRGNGAAVLLAGRLEITQQSPYDLTNVQLQLDGLDDVRHYRVHQAPVELDLEFPCEKTTLLDTYNPFHSNNSYAMSPPPATGTPDQYPLGDLGSKYGLLEGYRSYSTIYNETQLSLFGPYSIIGRSLVLHKKVKDRNWACSSIERGYSPSEAREVRAIASFHHPGGFAFGYVRMTQLIHDDGGASDTTVEVNLRYPGVRDRNYTQHHRWEVWVNGVGVDAAVPYPATRCVAAGYRWNPYFNQLADPLNHDLYRQECGADNPLRCDVGDLTSRLGTIDLGGPRQMFVDSNLPLEGAVSVMGRAIVVFGPDGSNDRLACANIEPDKDIIKFINIVKPPRFVVGKFLSDLRQVLGVPPWLVLVDASKTRPLPGGACLQLLLHFRGAHASQLELDTNRLLMSGRLEAPTLQVPGFVDSKRKPTTPYRSCGAGDPNENQKKTKNTYFFSSHSAPERTLSQILLWSTLLYFCRLLL